MTTYQGQTIKLRRTGRRPLTLRVLSQLPGIVIARDTPHRAGAFCPVLILDLETEENGTYRPLAGTNWYATESQATDAATGLVGEGARAA